MSLTSLFQRFGRRPARRASAAEALPGTPSEVEAARLRARRRLVGMVVLVGAGLIGFPWLFETRPRSMSSDVELVQAGGDMADGAGAGKSPRSVVGKVTVSGIVPPGEPEHLAPPPAPAPPQRAAAPEPAPAPAPAPVRQAPPAKPVIKVAPAPAKAAEKPAERPAERPAEKTTAKATDKAASSTRFVVQFGAFSDVKTAHEARMKVEKAGLKTYTQQISTPQGKRIRVRMGPYADRAEAEKALATLRKAGLNGAVLTL